MKKMITAILIAVMALAPVSAFAGTSRAERAASALQAYRQNHLKTYDRLVKGLPRYAESEMPSGRIARQYRLKLRSLNRKEISEVEFADIGGTKTPEMIVETGTSEADCQFHFYAYRFGKVVNLGAMNAGHTYLFRIPGKKGVYLHFAQMGYENIRRVRLVNGRLNRTTVLKERRIRSYDNFRNFRYTLKGVRSSFWK